MLKASGTASSAIQPADINSPRRASFKGLKPLTRKTSAPAIVIPTKFVAYKRAAPLETSGLPKASPIPTTLKGGTKATAIATPARVSESLALVWQYAPTAPAASATPRSKRVG